MSTGIFECWTVGASPVRSAVKALVLDKRGYQLSSSSWIRVGWATHDLVPGGVHEGSIS